MGLKADYQMAKEENIQSVMKASLCTGCGTCAAICPKDAIKLVINPAKGIYIPRINETKCSQCGICFEVCPGHSIDFKQLNTDIFAKQQGDILLGNYFKCYTGYSTDYDIRYNSASGGLVTQLLIFALEEKIIDGALVTRMKKDNPLEPEPFIARTREEIIEASKSKYCPVPANIALKEILDSKEGEKFAVVGLPCHIQGIRKAEQINKKLKESIVLHLGLFCNHGVNFTGTQLFLEKSGVKKEDVAKFNYRGQGWPGNTLIELINGSKKANHFFNYWTYPSLYFFTVERCFFCSDALCELADISFGDAWLPEFSVDKIGSSIVISRNKVSEELLRRVQEENKLRLQHISRAKLIESQKTVLYFKKKNLPARKRISQLQNKHLPSDNAPLLSENANDYLIALFLIHLNDYISSFQIIHRLLKFIPLRFIKVYQHAFYIIINSRKLE